MPEFWLGKHFLPGIDGFHLTLYKNRYVVRRCQYNQNGDDRFSLDIYLGHNLSRILPAKIKSTLF